MVVFDESKVINALHTDRAEVGKWYYCSDNIGKLKEYVENGDEPSKLMGVVDDDAYAPFIIGSHWQFLYPYEEPQKQRMTNRQLAEWLARGNGERAVDERTGAFITLFYNICNENEEVNEDIVIRHWGSDEWVEPTVDIYERDCK